MSWSTSKPSTSYFPSGSSWSSAKSTNVIKNNYYNYWSEAKVRRGYNNNICLEVKLYAELYSWEYRLVAPNIEMKAAAKAYHMSTFESSATYTAARPAFGATVLVKTLYWTGTLSNSETLQFWASNTADWGYSNNFNNIAYVSTFKVTYYGNSNTSGSPPGAQTGTYGSSVTILGKNTLARTGYTFDDKWNTLASGSGTTYNVGATYSGGNLNLYAVWKANTYTVTFNANGGSGGPVSQTKTYGQTMTISSSVPTRANYIFLGWAESSSATTAQYQPGGSYTKNITTNTVLYAVWKLAKIPVYVGVSGNTVKQVDEVYVGISGNQVKKVKVYVCVAPNDIREII